MSIEMGMQNFIKLYQKVQGKGSVSLFSEFEPRQTLDLSQISFDNLIGYILSISMCMQNFITIFFTVLEIGPFSLFSEFGARQSLVGWLVVLRLNVPVNNFSDMSGRSHRFLGN